MKSIEEKASSMMEIQKSKFLAKVFPLSNIEEVDQILSQLQKEYPDATHICYGYIFDNKKRFSDDGEPSGTAGMPILKVLEHQNLDHILACVIRYFGGIKLGAGGLVRAYTNSTVEALNQAKKVNLIKGVILKITFPYQQEKMVQNRIEPYPIFLKEYQEAVTYQLFLPLSYLPKIEEFSYQILEENSLGMELT